jgi:AraC-like DNA-binding protein/mannose-6-phosphate isomerase-like protein (cupin superfamily)
MVLHRTWTTSQSHVGLQLNRPLSLYTAVRGVNDWSETTFEPYYPVPRGLEMRAQPAIQRLQPHEHAFCEVTFVHGGRARHVTPDRTLEAARNTVIFVPLGKVHAYEDFDRWHVTNVSYLAEWLLDDLKAVRREDQILPVFFAPDLFARVSPGPVLHFTLTDAEMARCIPELESLAEELRNPAPSHLYLKSCLQKALVTLARALVRSGFGQPRLAFRPEIWSAIDDVETAVLQGEPFRVETAAERAGLSLSHFSRLFKDQTGRTLQGYYQDRRMQHARKLLLAPNRSITDVALQLGFASSSHFANAFRRYMGYPPRAYRRRYGAAGATAAG